jgi:hypothetical protein
MERQPFVNRVIKGSIIIKHLLRDIIRSQVIAAIFRRRNFVFFLRITPVVIKIFTDWIKSFFKNPLYKLKSGASTGKLVKKIPSKAGLSIGTSQLLVQKIKLYITGDR